MPGPLSRERLRRPIQYHDRQGRVWYASEVAEIRVVSPSIDGPNLCLVIRFEREGEERLAGWIGGPMDWRGQQTLHRLFESAESRPPGHASDSASERSRW
jgi:CelD/BcsL family acetyltransferase involved in cellulose biosynthesis